MGTRPGSMGSLVKGESYVPSHGGRILNPKMSIGEYGFVGHFEDCEGNRVLLHSGQEA